jgi:hypothetical protein
VFFTWADAIGNIFLTVSPRIPNFLNWSILSIASFDLAESSYDLASYSAFTILLASLIRWQNVR